MTDAQRLAEEARKLAAKLRTPEVFHTQVSLEWEEYETVERTRGPGHEALYTADLLEALAALAQQGDDVRDAARWRGVKARHGMSMVRLATGGSGYSSHKKDGILDAWADMACAEIAAHDPEAFRADMDDRIAELQAAMATKEAR